MKINLYSAVCRWLSLFSACAASTVILIMPQLMANADGKVAHDQLLIVMFGAMISFIHGVGFKPETRLFRYLFHPILGWTLMAIGLMPLSTHLEQI